MFVGQEPVEPRGHKWSKDGFFTNHNLYTTAGILLLSNTVKNIGCRKQRIAPKTDGGFACATIDLTMPSNVRFLHSTTTSCHWMHEIVKCLCIPFSSQKPFEHIREVFTSSISPKIFNSLFQLNLQFFYEVF